MVALRPTPMDAFDPAKDVRILREPAVYLVGRQVVDPTEVDRFLTDHGVSWQTDSEVAGERIVETAGRVCYMSFARPRPAATRRTWTTFSKSATGRSWSTPPGTSFSPAYHGV